MESPEEAKLQHFLQWLQVNGAQLRGCNIKYCDSNKGFGIFSSKDAYDEILLVVPLDLGITPMRVLQDPLFGSDCRAMFEEGEVDDRFLMILFLAVESVRKNSSWKPYLDMLPTTFGTPLWFSDDELLELKGTTLYRATELQKKQLRSVYEDKVKNLAKKLLSIDGDPECEVSFEDFLWANSIFWTRALNIPFPDSYVFPKFQGDQGGKSSTTNYSRAYDQNFGTELINRENENGNQVARVTPTSEGETVWVEGLVPGIDFCNHDLKAAATWEVDGTGSITQVPFSMYLLSAEQNCCQTEKEISISYGNKGNEELLYLYGFAINNNPDDYLMVHYPMEAVHNVPFSVAKAQLLEAQKAELRSLLPRSLLDHGFFPVSTREKEGYSNCYVDRDCNYSWSGCRKMPTYLNKLVFPDDFLTALRTIAMQEDELDKVSSLLVELPGTEGERQPSDTEVRAALWEACGDSGGLQLLVDLLNMKMTDLEEGSGTEENDVELLKKIHSATIPEDCTSCDRNGSVQQYRLGKNRWSSIVYRHGQKQLTRLFLREAEHALQLALQEGN